MTQEEILAKQKAYKDMIEQQKTEPVISKQEVMDFFDSRDQLPKDDKLKVSMVVDKVFSNFNNLNKYYTNCLSLKAVMDMEKAVGEQNMNFDNPAVKQYLKDNIMDCTLHKGFSLLKQTSPEMNNISKNFSRMLLEKTMLPPSPQNEQKVLQELGEENGRQVLSQNIEKQKIMAKTLFMAQIGKYSVKQKGVEGAEDLTELISETIVHGGRTNVILPYGENQQKVMDSIYGEHPKSQAGLKGRPAATHYVTRQKMNADGTVKSKSKEQSPLGITLHKTMRKQYGMNIAVGGIGEQGPDKKTILPNGSAGHMYVRKQLGDKNTCGSLLIGFESADSGAKSFTGHKHNFLAKSAKQSAFLADKQVVGKKTDGRTIDLSGITPQNFTKLMNEFDRVYSNFQKQNNIDQLEKLNSLLSGKRLDQENLIQSLKQFSFDEQVLKDTVPSARRGSIVKPKMPNLAKRILNTLTFGKAFKKDFEKYQNDLRVFEQERQVDAEPQVQASQPNVDESKQQKWPLDEVESNQLKTDTLAKDNNAQKSPPYSTNENPTITNQISNN